MVNQQILNYSHDPKNIHFLQLFFLIHYKYKDQFQQMIQIMMNTLVHLKIKMIMFYFINLNFFILLTNKILIMFLIFLSILIQLYYRKGMDPFFIIGSFFLLLRMIMRGKGKIGLCVKYP